MSLKTKQYDLLIEKGWIKPLEGGRFILNQSFVDVMDLFDRKLLQWAKEDGAESFLYPDLISTGKIAACQYMEQFHQHCYFSCHSKTDQYDEQALEPAGYINNPSICMHSYIQYEGSVIDSRHPVVLTAKGKCKRKEAKEYVTLDRLSDFTMREIVFMGPEQYVLEKRRRYMDLAEGLMKDLSIVGNIKESNDPFFKKEDAAKSGFQRRFKLKYELNFMDMDGDREVAVASFNYHGIHFGRAFRILTEDNKYIYTACMAFGLERLAYTYITQTGPDAGLLKLSAYMGDRNERG